MGRPLSLWPKEFRPSVAGLIVALGVMLLFLTSPKGDNFWWSDTAPHALNGALIHDYVASGFSKSPMSFATAYFLRYPALSITLYPPLFPVTEALVFAVIGFSHFAAQLTVALFTALGAAYLFRIFRSAYSPLASAGGVLLVFSLPVISLWSRQIMLEMPALALLAVSTAWLLRYLDGNQPKQLYITVFLLCAAVYTKQTVVFAAIAFAVTIVVEKGFSVFRQRAIWIAVVLGVILLIPLAVFTIMFASQSLDTVGGIGKEAGSHFSIAALTWYAANLPSIVGWGPLIAAPAYVVLVAVKGWLSPGERRLAVLMIAWLVADYLFISPIAHREERYGFFLAVPFAALSMGLVWRVVPERLFSCAAVAVGAIALAVALVARPVPRVDGYDKVAAYILDHSSQDNVVLFQGLRSTNFSFSTRSQSPTPKIFILRAEKLLVDYNIIRDWGTKDRNLSPADIASIFDRYGIVYVVFQPDFWTDLPSMAALQNYVYSDRFTKVAEFPISSNVPIGDKSILIFRNNSPTQGTDRSIKLDLPALKGAISGTY